MSTSRYDQSPYQPLGSSAVAPATAADRADDFWADVPPPRDDRTTALAAPAAPPAAFRPAGVDPLERVKRLLRGRILLAAALTTVGGLVGATLGYASAQPKYAAVGSVEVKPVIPGFGEESQGWPDYQSYMRSEARRIDDGTDLAIAALAQDEAWRGVDKPSPQGLKKWIEVDRNNRDYYTDVQAEATRPEQAIAAVRAMLRAYKADFEAQQRETEDAVIGAQKRELTKIDREIAGLDGQIADLAEKYGGAEDLSDTHERLRQQVEDAREQLDAVERALAKAGDLRDAAANLTVPELAEGDDRLRAMIEEEAKMLAIYRRERLSGGERLPAVRRMAEQVRDQRAAILRRAEVARGRYFGRMPDPTTDDQRPVEVTRDLIASLEAQKARLGEQLAALEPQLNDVFADRRDLGQWTSLRADLRDDAEAITGRLASAEREGQIQESLRWIDIVEPDDGTAWVALDGRNAQALGGFIMGAGLPLALVVGLGFLDRRFRYSDDAADLAGDTRGPAGGPAPLLGILPNLPDRLSDPSQASIAAHCVHQIRTILQIHHATPMPGDDGVERPQAFAVTGSGRGDGKTSLALALGLSYAASGCRTLLIDCDLQHGGLSRRLGVKGDEGVMDALQSGELLETVCETDVENLAVLPVGKAQAGHAGAFSPAAVRHLVAEAKRHFDVVLCDTGPVLGSIETTPVVSATNATIVVVARGQQRPAVERALRHLEHVGATVAGLVFNRASGSDFEKSVAGMNFRQLPAPRGGEARAAKSKVGGGGGGTNGGKNGVAAVNGRKPA